jgi:hypothetical protein
MFSRLAPRFRSFWAIEIATEFLFVGMAIAAYAVRRGAGPCRWAQNDPTTEPSAITAASAIRAPTMPTITMSR